MGPSMGHARTEQPGPRVSEVLRSNNLLSTYEALPSHSPHATLDLLVDQE